MTSTRTADEVREALTGGLAAAIADKGYAATTIADVVMHARVSKRTFYEHFTDKEACLLAGYEQISSRLMDVLRETTVPTDLPWQEQVRVVTAAYLGALEDLPAVNRALLLEVQAAGPRARLLRREVQRRYADQP